MRPSRGDKSSSASSEPRPLILVPVDSQVETNLNLAFPPNLHAAAIFPVSASTRRVRTIFLLGSHPWKTPSGKGSRPCSSIHPDTSKQSFAACRNGKEVTFFKSFHLSNIQKNADR